MKMNADDDDEIIGSLKKIKREKQLDQGDIFMTMIYYSGIVFMEFS